MPPLVSENAVTCMSVPSVWACFIFEHTYYDVSEFDIAPVPK